MQPAKKGSAKYPYWWNRNSLINVIFFHFFSYHCLTFLFLFCIIKSLFRKIAHTLLQSLNLFSFNFHADTLYAYYQTNNDLFFNIILIIMQYFFIFKLQGIIFRFFVMPHYLDYTKKKKKYLPVIQIPAIQM